MDKVTIKIDIDGHKHPMDVRVADEPIYREAGRLVNERIRAYASKYRGARIPHDFMVHFAAVDIAARYIRLKKQNNLDEQEEELLKLSEDLKQFLNNQD